jgi:glycosyltransferase involved in cell wall biosynthesis
MNGTEKKWIFVHLGARAHYQFPEAISERIQTVYTDFWIGKNFISRMFSFLSFPLLRKILQRNNSHIKNSKVVSFPFSLLFHELLWKLKGINGWQKIMRRNEWFQRKVKNHLLQNTDQHLVIFTFAYTALEILKLAEHRKWKTILYQMDPGIEEEKIVREEIQRSSLPSSWQPAPENYWQQWQEELLLADKIIVNSAWSKSSLLKFNIPEEKFRIIPLALEENKQLKSFERTYPKKFTSERPLRVLFLGILTMRKGLRPILEAIELLKEESIEFVFVGTPETTIAENPKVKVANSVSRAETASFYKEADVFLFPTLSDGFGLTQLEAFSWKLPVISSRFCGEVVENQKNGIVLEEVTAEKIHKTLIYCLNNPDILQTYSNNTIERLRQFSLQKLSESLLTVAD